MFRIGTPSGATPPGIFAALLALIAIVAIGLACYHGPSTTPEGPQREAPLTPDPIALRWTTLLIAATSPCPTSRERCT